MTYQELVDKSIAKMGHPRKYGKDKIEGYEQHHIVPVCMGGGDDGENIVYFTYAEHLMAHILLFRENPNNGDLAFTVIMMVGGCKDFVNTLVDIVDDEAVFFEYIEDVVKARKLAQQNASIRQKEWWTEDRKKEQSQKLKGENNPMYGIHRYGENNPMYGRSPSEETNEKRKASWTPEKRAKQSERMSGENNPWWGRHHTKESKQKISKRTKGKIVSNETRKKMSENHADISGEKNPMKREEVAKKLRGGNNGRALHVKCVETNEIFGSIKEASEITGISKHKIKKCCDNECETINGFHWKYVSQEEYLANKIDNQQGSSE